MTFYQELQLNQAGSKNLLKKSETLKEKLYHMWVYLVKIAATMAFCFFFVSIFSILFGNENSIVGVVVLLCLMVFRNADLGIHTGQSTMLLPSTQPSQWFGAAIQRRHYHDETCAGFFKGYWSKAARSFRYNRWRVLFHERP